MDPEFYITLPSNVRSASQIEENTIAKYRTQLKSRYIFPKEEKWKVALAEITYTKAWFNVTEKAQITFFDRTGKIRNIIHIKSASDDFFSSYQRYLNYEIEFINNTGKDITYCQKIFVKPGYYETIDLLIYHLNETLLILRDLFDPLPYIEYDRVNHFVAITPGVSRLFSDSEVFPDFGPEVMNILGLINNDGRSLKDIVSSNDIDVRTTGLETYKMGVYKGLRNAEINAGLQSLYIYSNVVDHNAVGDTLAQLLRVIEIPSNSKYGDNVTIYYDKPHFIPLQSNSFDSILLEIRDDTTKLVPFQKGRVIIKLIFKKYG